MAWLSVSHPCACRAFACRAFIPKERFHVRGHKYEVAIVKRFDCVKHKRTCKGLFTWRWGPQLGEVTCGGLPHLTCKRDHIKMKDYMDRRVAPPKRVTSPIWGTPPTCKQALSNHSTRHLDSWQTYYTSTQWVSYIKLVFFSNSVFNLFPQCFKHFFQYSFLQYFTQILDWILSHTNTLLFKHSRASLGVLCFEYRMKVLKFH